jgi:hypothetical protein
LRDPGASPGGSWDETAWSAFADELAAWRAAGRPAAFWWRDDDAGPSDGHLGRLIGLAEKTGVPLGLAVVPAWLEPGVAAAVRAAPAAVAVLQHGWAHVNHEPVRAPGTGRLRQAECGDARPAAVALAEIAQGWQRLAETYADRALPVFVPPWNRVAPAVRTALPGLGYRALSAFGPRDGAGPVAGLGILNCHVDPVVWREGRRFAGATATLDRLRGELTARRRGQIDPAEPIGLLTHHRVMTPDQWTFLEEWLERLRRHPAATFPAIPDLMTHSIR